MMQVEDKPPLLVLTTTLPVHASDPEPRFVLDLCKGLTDYFDITVLAPGHPSAPMTDVLEGVRIVRYRFAPFRSWETLAYPGAIMPKLRSNPAKWILAAMLIAGLYRRAAQLLTRQSFACVHCHWVVPQGIVGMLLKRRFGTPYLVTSHGGDLFSFHSAVARHLIRRIIRDAAQVTVVSEAIRNHVRSDSVLRTTNWDPAVIPMGVDTDRFDPRLRDEDWAQRNGLMRPVIAFAGRLDEKKGVSVLLDAMATEPLRSATGSLAIIGDGPLRRVLDAQVESLDLRDRVRFLGPLPHADLAIALASADVFCAPSVIAGSGDREGLPTVICEAAASGLAVVATRVGGIPEVVLEGVTGLLVPQRDPETLSRAIGSLLLDTQQRLAMGKAARRHIQAFSWANVSNRFRSAIASAISADRQPGIHA